MTILFCGARLHYAEYVRNKLLEYSGEFKTHQEMAESLGVSKGTVSQAVNRKGIARSLINALYRASVINKYPGPKDPRQRRWMRTDDIALARKVVEETYPGFTIAPIDEVVEIVMENRRLFAKSKTRQGF